MRTIDLPAELGVVESSWNLFVEQHGKCLVDSHFSVLTKYLENASLKSVIRTPEEICIALETEQQKSNQLRAQQGQSSISTSSEKEA